MPSIVVVGAGLAGLTCAWRLARAGHEVEVVECEDAPGGRLATTRRADFQLEQGAAWFERGGANLEGLLAALGLDERVRPLTAQGCAIWDGARHVPARLDWRAFARSSALDRAERIGLARLRVALAAQRGRLASDHPERAMPLDDRDAASWLRRTAGAALTDAILMPLLAARLHADPELLSAGHAAISLREALHGPALASLEGGLRVLSDALAERLTVRTGCEAIRVESAAEGARVHYRTIRREGSLLADAAVLALPATRVPFVCPKLTPAERAFFERVRYGRGIVVSLLLDKEPPGLPGAALVIAPAAGLDLRLLEVGHRQVGAAPRGTALLRAFLTEEASNRLWWAGEDALLECVSDALARTPVGRLFPGDCLVQRWDPLAPRFEPGHARRLASFLARGERSPRLAFAGDYLVGSHLEGAVTSGMRAAAEIAAALDGSRVAEPSA